ncbi:type II restriction endonuclease [Tumebacillus flagellatus]|uniref:Restriction endonuclease type II EcoRII C-terminal domain-containing protein n=1 Tax=Tumebacillus flagellatus TaxID=1157490 RepID=A0A074MHJ0_9BACL|nr:type II restriction endonuclease [Tumebacillus flagellatus]KEO85117.1 hypothetical protein EL26_00730 [Tumebacillus flagellatus]
MELAKFKKHIKQTRDKYFVDTQKMVDMVFSNSGYDQKPKSYFLNTPTDFLEGMRKELWTNLRETEKVFNVFVMEDLLSESRNLEDKIDIRDKDTFLEKVSVLLSEYDEHIIELGKSNTNSRRSRAGKEFEHTVHKLFLMSGIRFDPQGYIGQKKFEEQGLSKIVDSVVPGVLEYHLEKHKCALISMKTSLRERWQEVPEERSRTGAHMMYLITLDEQISNEIIDSLYEHNVRIVVRDWIKETKYKQNQRVLGLRNLIEDLLDIMEYWNRKKRRVYSDEQFLEKYNDYRERSQNEGITSAERCMWDEHMNMFKSKKKRPD